MAKQPLSDLVKQVNKIFHDVEADFYDARHPEIIGYERDLIAQTADVLWQHFGDVPQLICVDIGTGTGFVPATFAGLCKQRRKTIRWILCDISLSMLQNARSKLQKSGAQVTGCIVMDAERLPLARSTVDVITVNSVLHHLPRPDEFLAQCFDLLHLEGLLIVSHEPRLGYYRSLLWSVAKLVQYIMFAVNRLRAFLWRERVMSSGSEDSFWMQVESKLRAVGITNLSRQRIKRLVDFHSPTAGGSLDPRRGIDVGGLLTDGWEILEMRTYAHLGKLALKRSKHRLLRYIDRMLASVFPQAGSLFCFVARKARR